MIWLPTTGRVQASDLNGTYSWISYRLKSFRWKTIRMCVFSHTLSLAGPLGQYSTGDWFTV